ncbi:hypothetical protein JX265_007822 [Neoarthrinium moseri]|uniref:Uncharacterized protein n=1 Tax=Neoarthrinium moseri TaxID=1658444 RepID=A0A9P9WJE4_9PEZI|nr:uncharacterized protein JN550_003402 [Neoarthrinium moseri]KAI1843347.1 hypothetical protein JX266_010521 [Neoarthrinium moseri]KAI1866521.1 hypothetical protein JX265_007822 [Neoarthrinium moseri]KAI1873149.1 hypothetical protein JN550_003402 [Neoarthrinium moseri]
MQVVRRRIGSSTQVSALSLFIRSIHPYQFNQRRLRTGASIHYSHMPRITVSRVIGLIPLTWFCLVGTWFFLPSPVVSPINRPGTIASTLQSGGTITAVVENKQSFKRKRDDGIPIQWACSGCSGLVLDWRLESHAPTDSLLLHLGEARINLTEAALQGPQPDADEKATSIYVSPPIKARIRTGSTRHSLIMPWFTWADSILTYWTMHYPREDILVRTFSPEPGVVEIWKDIEMWDAYAAGNTIRETDREVGLLGTFSHVPTTRLPGAPLRANAAGVKVAGIQGELPSRTWPIRGFICGPLYVPTFMIAVVLDVCTFGILTMKGDLILGMLVVLLALIRTERMVLSPSRWLCRPGTKRPKQRGIWGPSGPVADEESGLLKERPLTAMSMFPHPISKPSRSRAPILSKS